MILSYLEHAFEFRNDSESTLSGCLILNNNQKNLLSKLIESEKDDWSLDRSGERLPPEILFELSAWSFQGPNGKIKILNRYLNLETGEATFSTPETYGGEMLR